MKAEPLQRDAGRLVQPPGRGRGVPLVFGVVSVVLVAFALTFALSSPPPSTPPLAEVAPAPQEQVEVERVEQSSRFGEGAGGEGDCAPGDEGCEAVGSGPDSEPSVAPSVGAGEPGSAAQFWPCVNGPGGARQTQDPQSAPCIGERFVGDNGGATSAGVTGEAIRIAVPAPIGGCFRQVPNQCGEDMRVVSAFAAHVEKHYELYGRRLDLVEVPVGGSSDRDAPESQRAFAGEVAAIEPFAVLQYRSGAEPFYRAVAGHAIVAFDPAMGPVDERGVYQALHPYVWGVHPGTEEALDATGALICRALVGRPAQHGGPDVSGQVRRFGIVQDTLSGRRVEVGTLVATMDACGAPYVVREIGADPGTADREALLRRFQDDGVTTVLCACGQNPTKTRFFGDSAQAIGYQPEWLLAGFGTPSRGDQFDDMDREQRGHVFGLVPALRQPPDLNPGPSTDYPTDDQYWFTVLKEEDRDFPFYTSDLERLTEAYDWYAQFLILAAGIQWAGPDLTPQTFAGALTGLAFPNPGVGQPRWYQPAVGFGPVDHTFTSDFGLAWWRNPPVEEEQAGLAAGQLCYVGDGARFTAAAVAADADDLLFDPEAGCR
ncbi:MAG TPA: hypothetical protein VGA69_11845 [Nitriliruptorales bacterium]